MRGDYNRMHAYLVTMAKAADAVVVKKPPSLSEGTEARASEKITLTEAFRLALPSRLTNDPVYSAISESLP